jgi:hypothetical protein
MASDGCFITSYAMCLKAWGVDTNPGEVLDRLLAVNGLDGFGQLTYSGVERAYPQIHFHDRIYTSIDPRNSGAEMDVKVALMRIRRLLDLGQPVILTVDCVGNDRIADHAVACFDYKLDGNVVIDLKIHDPAFGKTMWISEHYGRPLESVYGYVALIGPPITETVPKGLGVALWKSKELMRAGMQKDYGKIWTYGRELADTIMAV